MARVYGWKIPVFVPTGTPAPLIVRDAGITLLRESLQSSQGLWLIFIWKARIVDVKYDAEPIMRK